MVGGKHPGIYAACVPLGFQCGSMDGFFKGVVSNDQKGGSGAADGGCLRELRTLQKISSLFLL